MRLLRSLALFVSFFCSSTALAVEVAGLYEASVPVSGQGAGERAKAIAEGFRQVLVKVSGQRAVLANPAVQQELSKAASLLGSYRYETVRADANAPGLTTGTRIRLAFDQGGALGVLNRAGAPVWSANRPLVYLWTFREATTPTVFALGSPQVDALLEAAGQRGLPVTVPSPGELLVPAGTIPPASVMSAASRAGAKVVVAAAVGVQPGGKVRALGVLHIDGGEERIEVVGADEPAALAELVNVVADALGGRFGAVARKDQLAAVTLRIDGVRDLAGWAGVERWILSQPLVKDAVLVRLDTEGTEFALMLAGEPELLWQALQSDARFGEVARPVLDGSTTRLRAVLAGSAGP